MLLLSIILLVASTAQSPAEKGYIPTPDGTRLFYQKVGTGSQVVIIPLGFLLYKDFLYLANEDRTIIFYDVRNRGRSDAIVNSKLIGLLHDVEDIETVRKHFGFQQFSAIGYSYLGKVVVLYGLTYPGHLERIIQLGPVPLKFGTEYPAEFQANDSDAVLNKDELQKLRNLRKEGFDKKHPKEYCEMEWRLTRLQLLGNPANADKIDKGICNYPNEWPINLARHFEALLPTDKNLKVPVQDVAKLHIPILTIHGTRDRNASYGSGREWATILPNARLLTVPGAAHQSWIDAPDLVLPAMNEFLSGRWPKLSAKLSDV